MRIFIKGEEVPGTNKVKSTQHGELTAGEPDIAAGSETPVDPDEDEDKDTHVLGSGDCKTALVAQEAGEPVNDDVELLGFDEVEDEHIAGSGDCNTDFNTNYTDIVRRLS